MRRGTRVGQAYVAVTADGSGLNEGIVDAVDDAGDDIEKSGSEHGDRYGENFSDGALDRIRDNLAKGMAHWGLDKQGTEAGDRLGSAMVTRLRERLDGAHDLVDGLTRRLMESDDKDIPLITALTHGLRSAQNEATILERQLRAVMKSEGLLGSVSGNGSGGLGGRGRDNDTLGDTIGRMFGAGSRNNFLNVLGKSMGGMINLLSRAGSLASTFATNMGKAAEGASLMQRLMAGFGGGGGGGAASMFARIGASAPLAVAGIGAVMFAMSAMVSVVGALVAILTALVSTIVSALVGALAVAGPAIAAVAGAAGLLVAAFTSMTEAQRNYLLRAFEPFHQAITGVGQIIMVEFVKPLYAGRSAIQVWSANLQRALLPLAGVASTTARAFADAGNTITASLSGPGFQRFFNSLGSELPKIVRSLSVALGGFMNGMAGMFAAIMPYVTQFARHLAGVATRFSEWANSAKGQNAISDFVGRAVESLKSLWGFLKSVGGFLADVFFNPVSQRAGNSIFDSLTAAFEGFRRAFNKAARSGDLERWFSDAIDFGSKLWAVIKALYDTFIALYNSGVLESVGTGLGAFATFVDAANTVLVPLIDALGYALPLAAATAVTPLMAIAASVIAVGEAIEWLGEKLGLGNGAENPWRGFSDIQSMWEGAINPGPQGFIGPIAPGLPGGVPLASDFQLPEFTLPDLTIPGAAALASTFESNGGHMPDPTKGDPVKSTLGQDEWTNPLKDWAEGLLAQAAKLADDIRATGRTARQTIRDAIKEVSDGFQKLFEEVGKTFTTGIMEAAKSTDYENVISSLQTMIEGATSQMTAAMEQATASAQATIDQAIATRQQMIDSAEQARQSALQAVANASNKQELKAAMAQLKQAEKDLDLAYKQGDAVVAAAHRAAEEMLASSSASMDTLQSAADILAHQSVMTLSNVFDLARGLESQNATLADYAGARYLVAQELEKATQALVDAIALRDNYFTAVSDSVKAFGSLLTAQAKVVNGVQQALTATDITDSMRERLNKVRAFQENLRQLLAMGLSESAYKQLVDAGVETGGAYAEAILKGGQGSVSEINNLTSQFEAEASNMGSAASTFMYQAGVDAAQGLVDGLTSLSAELETAAYNLGLAVAQAVRDALGIASPSRVLMADMEHVGDGAVIGLDNQQYKVAAAAARLADLISVSPEVAAYAAQQGTSPTTPSGDEGVSGNGGDSRFRDLIVHTPTEDPMGVAMEVLNEVTGRLP